MKTNPPLPLEGITIVALEHVIAAPFATRQLADMGARVIKIERPPQGGERGGDFARYYDTRAKGQSSHFVWVNRSKESLALDLKDPASAEVMARLLAKADVLIQNLAPGATARMGLDYAGLKDRYPQLIVCDVSGYGQNGPYRNRKAYDLLIQSEAGFLSTTGTASEPAKSGISIADIAAGMYAYTGILNALFLRQKTGKGSHLDISMLEALTEWMSFPLYYAYDGAAPPPRAGASHATIYPYGPFKCADGTIVLGLQNEREWQAFCIDVLRDPPLAQNPQYAGVALRSQHRDALKALIEAVLQAFTVTEIEARLDAASIGYGRMNEMTALWAHPQLAARERWAEVDSPNGPIRMVKPAGENSAFEPRMGAIPAVGEHSEAILRELGF